MLISLNVSASCAVRRSLGHKKGSSGNLMADLVHQIMNGIINRRTQICLSKTVHAVGSAPLAMGSGGVDASRWRLNHSMFALVSRSLSVKAHQSDLNCREN